jgi:predicted nucleotidyltransferase
LFKTKEECSLAVLLQDIDSMTQDTVYYNQSGGVNGMQMNEKLELITETIKKTVDCDKIYLFGSHAYGTPNQDSDFDIYVVFPDGPEKPLDIMQRASVALAQARVRVPIDILAAQVSRFSYLAARPTLEQKVAREGVLLYERGPGALSVV